ncbi:hypothetical protein X798_04331 [Onchocerca flexuosa]|uniref:Uncharacterized protein n=1 Tax=Onchocerca flexuosa TaxID=387005 RepID=A0A238BVC9_9BILA|nr:hypothetical protein X798_04331 [Onchocerca flexuosa]
MIIRQRQAATVIQRAYRMHLAQKEFEKLRLEANEKTKAACMIQRYYRGYIRRKKRQRYQRAAVIIQVVPTLVITKFLVEFAVIWRECTIRTCVEMPYQIISRVYKLKFFLYLKEYSPFPPSLSQTYVII